MTQANQYLPFGTGSGANTLSYAAYSTGTPAAVRGTGYVAGTADAMHINTALRQVSVAVAAVAQLAADYGTHDVLDNGVVSDFKVALLSALDALFIRDSDFAGLFSAALGTAFNSRSLTQPGYQFLPGGLCVQWGYLGSTGGQVSFPVAFPSTALVVLASNSDTQGSNNDNAYAYVVDRTKFYIGTKASGGGLSNYPCYWFAIGY